MTQSSTIYKQEAVAGRGKRKVMDTKNFMPLHCKLNWYISFQVRFVSSERRGVLLQNQKFAKHWLLPSTSPTVGRKMTQFIVHLTICRVGWCLQQSYQRLYAIHASWKQYFVTPITQIIPNNPVELTIVYLTSEIHHAPSNHMLLINISSSELPSISLLIRNLKTPKDIGIGAESIYLVNCQGRITQAFRYSSATKLLVQQLSVSS